MKVVILCGGQGYRLREETEYIPKPMVEIGGRPILWHIMKLYSYYGFNDFILALGYKGDSIRNYFLNYKVYNNDFTISLGKDKNITFYKSNENYNWNVTMVETGQDSMTGYRLKLCEKYIKENNFMLTYGDAVADINIKKLIEFYKKQNTLGTVTGVFPPSRFGDLVVNENLVRHFKEKQADFKKQNPINGGFFVFKKEFLKIIPDEPDCDLEKYPMNVLTGKNQLSIFRHNGFWQCMDTYRDYLYLNKLWKKNPVWKIW